METPRARRVLGLSYCRRRLRVHFYRSAEDRAAQALPRARGTLFAPSHDDALLGVAFGGAAFLMLAVEEARARRLLSLDEFLRAFPRSARLFIALTHFYLLMGCALPHGLNLILKHDGADCLVLKLGGVAVLGAATRSLRVC